jgi:hypothetical protein
MRRTRNYSPRVRAVRINRPAIVEMAIATSVTFLLAWLARGA